MRFEKFVRTNKHLFSNESSYYGSKGDVSVRIMLSVWFEYSNKFEFFVRSMTVYSATWGVEGFSYNSTLDIDTLTSTMEFMDC